MTPKTQSVCKHCGEKIFQDAGVWWSKSPSGLTSYAACQDDEIEVVRHEPAAQPSGASTGEIRIVCKHCQHTIKPCWLGHSSNFCLGWLHDSNYHDCEDGLHKAEPASTGEPPPVSQEVADHNKYGPMLPRNEPARPSGPSAPFYSEQELKDLGLKASTINYGAEGSATMYSKAAPQPSAEPACDFCENRRCSHPLMWHKGKLVHHATGKSGYYPCKAAPVSGDAPNVDEIARELATSVSHEDVVKATGAFLRRYSSPASQPPTIDYWREHSNNDASPDWTQFPLDVRHKLDNISVEILSCAFAAEEMRGEMFDAKYLERNVRWNQAMVMITELLVATRASQTEKK